MTHPANHPLPLHAMPLFEGLTDAELAAVAACVRRRAFPAGASIIAADTPGDIVYLILAGTVKIRVVQPDGDEIIIAMLGPGEVVGELSVVDSAGRSADVEIQEDSALGWIDRASFERLLEEIPALARNLARVLARRVRASTEQIRALCALDVYGKVARQLLAFASQYGQRTADGTVIPMRLTQGDIAGLVGASRERVNQVFVSLRRRGLIAVQAGHRIVVRDTDSLRSLVEQR